MPITVVEIAGQRFFDNGSCRLFGFSHAAQANAVRR
jgi:hypothetical protein